MTVFHPFLGHSSSVHCLVCNKFIFLTWPNIYTSDITSSRLLQPLRTGPEVALLTGVSCMGTKCLSLQGNCLIC